MSVWYQNINTDIETIREERNSAISTSQALEFSQKAQLEEVQRLRAKYEEAKAHHDDEIRTAQAQISALNSTSRAIGYANYPDSQLPGASDVVIIIKTGATEAFRTLPIHLATTLTHTPNHLIFSDHNQTIAQHQIQDALDEVSPDLIAQEGDFQLYRDQKQYLALGQSAEALDFPGGWELDKYKNVHMLAKTWTQRPDAKWYLFIDADSYVVVSNLLPYLSGLDHTKKLYLGAAARIAGLAFGHGGTGYVLSHAAVEHVMGEEPGLARRYERTARENCCGDYVLARALADNGIELSEASPQFQGDPQYKVSMDREKFCQPVLTLHHMLPGDVGKMWEFERRVAKPGEFVLFRDVFEEFVWPYLREVRLDWDNMGGDMGEVVECSLEQQENLSKEKRRANVFEKCKKACHERKNCVQFRTWREECKISQGAVMLGYKVPVSRDDNEEFRSGWMMERVEELRKLAPCKQPASGWPQNVVRGS